MSEASAPKRVTRRTVAKGAAWTVPAVVVAAPAASAATSPPEEPPPPFFDWDDGCATVGSGSGGCNGIDKTPQVPVFLSNPTGQALVFQVTGSKFWNFNQNEPAAYASNHQLWTNTGAENPCAPQITTTSCGGYLSVTVAAGTCAYIWVVGGAPLQNASAFWAKFIYRWVTPAPECTVVDGPHVATPDVIIPSNNCNGSTVSLPECTAA